MITYTYTATYNFDTTGLKREINDWAEDYGYEDLNDLISQNEFDLLKNMIDTYLTDYADGDEYNEIFNSKQRDELIELILQDLLKGKNIQIPLDI